MPFPVTLVVGIAEKQAMTIFLAPNLATKIGLTRRKHLTMTTRRLEDRSQEGLGEGDPTILVENLENPLHVARWFVTSITIPIYHDEWN